MDFPDIIVTWKKIGPGTREGLMVSGALGGVIALVLIWAIFIRKRRRKRKHHYHYPSANSSPVAADVKELEQAGKRKSRRRRREHRPRNPTLAETGGLPPIRPDGDTGPVF